jgi:predicted transcriptional regulator
MMSEISSGNDLQALTTQVVTAYLSANALPTAALPELISTVYASLASLSSGGAAAPEAPVLTPAVAIKKSVRPDEIICLECGKGQKMLKRHLMTAHSLSTDDYRAKWGLPADYPMVAPNYAAHRSELAIKIGLGRKPGSRAK